MRCFVFGLLLFCCGCAGRTEKIGPAVIDSVNGSEEVQSLFQDDLLSVEDTQESKDLASGEEVWGIRLRVADVTPAGLTLICEQSGGNPTGELQTGPMFWLERQVDGVWGKCGTDTVRRRCGCGLCFRRYCVYPAKRQFEDMED